MSGRSKVRIWVRRIVRQYDNHSCSHVGGATGLCVPFEDEFVHLFTPFSLDIKCNINLHFDVSFRSANKQTHNLHHKRSIYFEHTLEY